MMITRTQIVKSINKIVLFPVIFLMFSVFWGCQGRHIYKDSRFMMGTTVLVLSSDQRAADIAFDEISRIEHLLSIYKQDSEISQLNKQGKIKASPDTLYVIKKAKEFWQATGGAFDVTIAPLMEAWGFYKRNYRVPDSSEIKGLLDAIGFDKVKINGNIIEFKIKGMKMDLGAIAKGFAIDSAVRRLRLAGIKSALLNAGGDIYCLGDKQGLPWRVAIKKGESLVLSEFLELYDKAVATSGDYEQYFVVGNVRYCHILNPKSGRPADSGIISVSVIANDCLTADCLATSIFVMGKQKGEALAKRFNVQLRIYTDA